MHDPAPLLALAAFALAGLTILTLGALRGWRDWLDVERLRIAGGRAEPAGPASTPAARIELADLKERIRKLEAIAAGIDL